MPTKYTRRPFAMGNTANPVVVTPELRGSLMKNSSGEFAVLSIPSELAIETEESSTLGGVSAVFSTAATMTQILADINNTAGLAGFVTAEEVEGCLVLKSTGTGEGAYVRVMPPVSGFDDASAVFGFEVHPHPHATVSAGDLLDAPVRPRQQVNPIGTKFIAAGEDRVGSAYNRALQTLALNSDTLYTWLQRSVARAVSIEVDAVEHAAYLTTNADGSIAQVDLSDLSAFDASLGDVRLCVGGTAGLTKDSTLAEISALYTVTDSALKEIPAQERTVRIGAVTRGKRTAVLPTFADDVSAPTSPVPNTLLTTVDGGNALGVDRAKHAGVVVTEIRQRTTIVCAGATFVTNGVTAGDVATISGAAISSPFNHDGIYLVETVVSEEELVLRPVDTSETVRELNPETGAFGSAVISSGGEWERSIWVSFYPPIPRMPEDGKIVLTIPVEAALGALALADLVKSSTRTNNNVDGWALLNLWRGLTLAGVYQGMSGQSGSGFFGAITHRPLRADRQASAVTSAGTTTRSSTGAALLDQHTLRLTAAAADRFDVSDVGLTILLNAGPLLANEPWTIVRLIDNATVELAPPIFRTGYQEPDGSTVTITSWSVVEGDAIDVHGTMHVISPEFFGDGNTAPAEGGYIFSREQRDAGTADPPVPGFFSFLHLERIRLTNGGTNITITTSGPLSADNVLPLSFAPEDTSNIFGETYETKTGLAQSSLTFVRLLNGKNAGLYRVKDVKDASVSSNAVVVQRLDGSPVVFTAETEVQVAFYNAKVGMSVPVYGGPGALSTLSAAMSLFADAKETGHTSDHALRVGWRGVGGGILAYVNDPEFRAFDNGDGGDGPLITAILHAPAEGVDLRVIGADSGSDARRSSFGFRIRAHTSRHDYSLSNPGPRGSLFHSHASFGGYIGQTGDDPALILVKQEADEAGDESVGYSRLTPSAALGVGRARGTSSTTDNVVAPTGRGSAIETAGSIWVYRRVDHGQPASGWAEGGVFVEDTVGAGRWLYPMVGTYDFSATLYQGTGAYSGWEAATRLGNPGQVLPSGSNDALPSADLLEPDYALFNFDHSGILHVVNAAAIDIAQPYNRYIGCRVVVEEAGHGLEDDQFAVVGIVAPVEGGVYLALYKSGVTVAVADVATVEFRILGQRWFETFADLGSWSQIGTALDVGSPWLAPALTGGPFVEDQVYRGAYADYSTLVVTTEGALSHTPFYPNAYGAGVGAPLAVADMPGVEVSVVDYTSGWQEDALEPRGPIPDIGVITSDTDAQSGANPVARGGTLNEDTPGSLLVDDFALEHVVKNSDHGAVLSFDTAFGGCLSLSGNALNLAAAADDTLRIWMRGGIGVSAKLFALQAQVTLYLGGAGSKALTLLLVADSGTEIASSGVITVTPGGDYPTDVLYTFSEADIFDGGADLLLQNDTVGVHLVIETSFDSRSTLVPGSGEEIRILRMLLNQVSRPARVYGHLDVLGSARVQDLRAITPVRGFQTVTPLEVELLNGEDFAKVMGNHVFDDATFPQAEANANTQEQRGVGLVYDSAKNKHVRPTFQQDLFFKKGPHSASIVFYHPYFDPLFYRVTAGDPTTWIRPGRTGFLIPLDPPHGAKLTSAHFAVSLRACTSRKELVLLPPFYDTNFQIWHSDEEFDDTNTAPADHGDKATWDAREGFLVRIWRFHALDFGEDMEVTHSNGVGQNGPSTGYSEVILEKIVDLSAVDEPDPADDVYETGDEYTYRGAYNLLAELASSGAVAQSALTVDRRHFGYFATIEFFGGCRRIDNSGTAYYAYDYLDEDGHIPYTVDLGGSNRYVEGVAYMYPPDSDPVGSTAGPQYFLSVPPAVKFRGFRLGWTTDRIAHGGW